MPASACTPVTTVRLITTLGGVVSVLLLTGCSLFASTDSADVENTDTGPAASEETHHHGDGHVHDEFYEGIPDVTWSSQTDAEVTKVATEVINLFARPGVPERRWYSDLVPYLSEDYAEDAQYIDPANVRVTDVLSGPDLVREQGNPLTVAAEFSTDAGPWSILLHRVGQDDPWLVEAIQPTDSLTPTP